MRRKAPWMVMCLLIILGMLMPTVGLGQENAGKVQNKIASEEPGTETLSWSEQIKNPVPWFKWGFDQRLRTIYADNFLTLDQDVPGHAWHFQRFRSRLWGTFMLDENLEINTRLVWEWRNWCKPNPLFGKDSNVEFDEALFDRLNVKISNAFGAPLDITLGRQDIILGNAWLVLDGTPFDGSRTIFFDAARFTYNIEDSKTKIDMIYINQGNEADLTIEPFNDQERAGGLTEQDERGAILYVTNKSLIPKGQLDGYFIWKHDKSVEGVANSNDSDIYTLGARIAGAFDDNWKYRAEFAQQAGKKNYDTLCAFGFNSRLGYDFNDSWKSNLHADYEYLSGDNPSTRTNEQFDLLWGRWPRWSELYIYTYAVETRIAETTNLHRLGGGWIGSPTEKIQLCLDYHLLFTDENTRKDNPGLISFSNNGPFRGQLVTALLKYKYSEHISSHILGEFFFPGNYYSNDNDDPAMFLRYELMLTF